MDQPARVTLGERVGNLRRNLHRAPHVDRTAAHLVAQRRTGRELVGEIALVILLDDIEQRGDVRMIERGGRPRFAQKPLALAGSPVILGRRVISATVRPTLRSRAR